MQLDRSRIRRSETITWVNTVMHQDTDTSFKGSRMSAMDIFGMTDKLGDRMLDVMITRLEACGQHPIFRKMLQDYLEAMTIDSAQTVLDMGCGTGIVARTIADRAGFSGTIVGIDLSAYLLEAATSGRWSLTRALCGSCRGCCATQGWHSWPFSPTSLQKWGRRTFGLRGLRRIAG
jgi:2-polyprenyl-3-methyl-5-hydroxy-6-metoxy-1,4-benzoquinol methylase